MSNLFKYCLYRSHYYKNEVIIVFMIPVLIKQSELIYLILPTCGISDTKMRHEFLRSTPFKKLSDRKAIKILENLSASIGETFIDTLKSAEGEYKNVSETFEVNVHDSVIDNYLPNILSKLRDRVKQIENTKKIFDLTSTSSEEYSFFKSILNNECELFKIQ